MCSCLIYHKSDLERKKWDCSLEEVYEVFGRKRGMPIGENQTLVSKSESWKSG